MPLFQHGVYRPMIAASLAIAAGLMVTLGSAGASMTPGLPASRQHEARNAVGITAVIADPGDAQIGASARFDASGSVGDGLSFGWDFGDGTPVASGASVQHTFTRVDDYIVHLTVQNSQGEQDSAARAVRVLPAVDTLTGQSELGQIVPAGSFSALLSLNAAGPSQVSVKVGGKYLSSERWDFVGGNSAALFEIPDVRVVNEDDPDITSELLSVPGGSIPLLNNVAITLTYAVSEGTFESATYTVSLLKELTATTTLSPRPAPTGNAMPSPSPGSAAAFLQATPAAVRPLATVTATVAPGLTPRASATPAGVATPVAATVLPPAIWSITYPTYLPIVGLPIPSDDVNGYYLKGDTQFHSVDALTLRRFAIKIARNGGVFPNDPQRAADNIYRYVNGLLGISDPGELQKDLIILSRIDDGVLVPGARKGEYICIAHAYFLSSLIRTLGLPDREETIGFGRGVSQDVTGAWSLNFYQEGANEVWYSGAWHHYDTWVGTRNRDDYLDTSLTEIAWYAFSEQSTPFLDLNAHLVGLSGHDFALGKYVGSPGSPEQWRFLEQHTRPGIRIAEPGPEAYLSTDRARPALPMETLTPGILNPESPAETTAPAGQ